MDSDTPGRATPAPTPPELTPTQLARLNAVTRRLFGPPEPLWRNDPAPTYLPGVCGYGCLICGRCNVHLDNAWQFCPFCGTPIVTG